MLLSEGHAQAGRYPLVVLWQEAQIVRERINGRIVTDTLMLDAVVRAHMSTGSEAHDHLKKLIEGLRNGR